MSGSVYHEKIENTTARLARKVIMPYQQYFSVRNSRNVVIYILFQADVHFTLPFRRRCKITMLFDLKLCEAIRFL